MNDRNPELPEKDEAIANLFHQLGDVPADAGFQNRLRESFVSGAIDPGTAGVPAPVRRLRRRPWWAAAVAAVLVTAVLLQLRSPSASWLVLEALSGSGTVTVNGLPVSVADAQDLESALAPGATVEVPDGVSLTLVLEDAVVWELVGGSRMVLPGAKGPDADASATLRLLVGELRIRTGARFQGATLTVQTPEALVHVLGSALSVQCSAMGTCVCVLEGHVEVGKDEADLEPIAPGLRKVVSTEGEVQIIPVAPPHKAGVEEFLGRVRGRLPDR